MSLMSQIVSILNPSSVKPASPSTEERNPPSNDPTSMTIVQTSHNRRDSEAADALAALAQSGRRSMSASSSSNRDPSTSLPPISPTSKITDMTLKREESHEPSSAKLPPLSMLLGPVEQESKSSGNAGPAAIPLFNPAPVDRTTERKASIVGAAPRSVLKKSESPIPVAIKTDKDEDNRISSEFGLRGSRKTSETQSTMSEQITYSKKRPAPKSAISGKKGTAKRSAAGPAKKRKIIDPDTPTSNDTRDTTPASYRGRGGIKGRNSMTPAVESPSATAEDSEGDYDDEEGDESGDDEVFCECRKPDDHSYMIACDAGCNEWFHGRCVKITEDEGRLIDKFVCKGCVALGKGVTTWKPKCRRHVCRKPARLTATEASKYCSHDCGLRFFQELIQKTSDDMKAKPKRGHRRKSSIADLPDSRSGPIDPFQLKALIDSVQDSKAFRSLGNGVLAPPTPGTNKTFSSLSVLPDSEPSPPATPLTMTEQAELDLIALRKEKLRESRQVLEDRKRYFSLAKDRLAAYLDTAGLKPKDVCGFDQRLSWSTERFLRWRNSPLGVAAYENNSLDHVSTNGTTNGNIDHKMQDVDAGENEEEETVEICKRKKCERHRHWQKLQLEEQRFEESGLADSMRDLDRLEGELRERARLRARREVSGLLDKLGSVVPANGQQAFIT